jgi:hypothetical protein
VDPRSLSGASGAVRPCDLFVNATAEVWFYLRSTAERSGCPRRSKKFERRCNRLKPAARYRLKEKDVLPPVSRKFQRMRCRPSATAIACGSVHRHSIHLV